MFGEGRGSGNGPGTGTGLGGTSEEGVCLGSSAFASPRLFRGVTLSLVVVVAAFVGAGKDDRTRLPDCWPASALATVIDFRRGILEGDGGAGRGTVVGVN
jgi:hypothetical protein